MPVIPSDVSNALLHTASKMHQALRVDDIVYHILECLAVPMLPDPAYASYNISFSQPAELEPEGRRSLTRLARTCRAFSHSALQLLWRRLSSLTPLLSLLAPLEAVSNSPDSQESGNPYPLKVTVLSHSLVLAQIRLYLSPAP